jgi:hypothetical protein
MIGFRSFLMSIALALAFFGIVLFAVWLQRQQRRKRHVFLGAVFGLAGVMMVVSIALNLLSLRKLRALRPDDIEAVVVGDVRISDRGAIADIAPCFAEGTWFQGIRRTRGRGILRPFEIVRRDGSREQWSVAALQDGAAIDFGALKSPIGGPARGWAYLGCLPEKLRAHAVDFRPR